MARADSTRRVATTSKGLLRSKLWLEMAIRILKEEGVDQVRVDRIADRLGITKGSFYHLYKDRQELLDAMVEHWRSASQITYLTMARRLKGPARQVLLDFMEAAVRSNLGEFDGAFRAWGSYEPRVGATVQALDQERIQFIAKWFEELGLEGLEALGRARILYYADVGWAFSGDPRPQVTLRLEFARDLCSLLTRGRPK